jgi:hypothetical protein
MNLFLQDPDEVRLPPEEVRLYEVQVKPQLNGRQVKIYLELTPFLKRPNVEVTITAASGSIAAHSTILETMLRKLEFTMHLRQPESGSEYSIECTVYYQKLPELSDVPMELPLPEPMVVDRHMATFILPKLST